MSGRRQRGRALGGENLTAGERGGFIRTSGGRIRLGWRILLFLSVVLFVATLAGLVVPQSLIGGSVVLLLGSLVGGWALLALDGRGPGALGFYVGRGAPLDAIRGVGLGGAVAVSVVAAIALFGGLRWTSEPGTAADWLVQGAAAMAFLALPAAAEEAFLRGYPLQALTEAWGPLWGLVVTSVLFGAMHLANPDVTALAVLNVGAAGFFLGVVYLRTGSLWWATGAHLGWNWSHGFLADVPVSGLEVLNAPFYEGHARGPAWLGGAGFGPEGSALATVIVIAATLVCWRAPWLAASAAARAARPLVLVDPPAAGAP